MTQEEREKRDKDIIEMSKLYSQKELGKIYKLSETYVGKILRKNNIKRKKSRLNMSKLALDIDYFKVIDNPKKAYWLGYITADGSINKNNSKLSICCKDLELLEKFKKDISSGHKISNFVNYDKRTNKTYHEYTLQITNELFVGNIIEKGITNNKTDCCVFPQIEEKFYSYFIAGLFDGDGSVCMVGNKIRCNLISTKEILIFINNYLFERFDIVPCKITSVTNNKTNVYKQYWYKNAKKFLSFIYSGERDVFLSRKYKLYEEYGK